MHLSRTLALALVLVFRFISDHTRAGIVGRVFTVILVCSQVRPHDAFSLSLVTLTLFDVLELVLRSGRMLALRLSFILLVLWLCAPVRSASSRPSISSTILLIQSALIQFSIWNSHTQ